MMNNKEKILKKITPFKLVGYTEQFEQLNEENLNKVLDGFDYGGNTDVPIQLNGESYIVEIYREGLEPEIDLNIISVAEYETLYGRKYND